MCRAAACPPAPHLGLALTEVIPLSAATQTNILAIHAVHFYKSNTVQCHFPAKFLVATHPSPPANSTQTKLYFSVGSKHLRSAFQGQGGFHIPHAMKTLLDPERHNIEGVFRNQGGCQHLCRQKVHPSTSYLNALGFQSLPCVTRSRQGADGCALGVVGEQANRAPQQQDLLKGDTQQLLCAC